MCLASAFGYVGMNHPLTATSPPNRDKMTDWIPKACKKCADADVCLTNRHIEHPHFTTLSASCREIRMEAVKLIEAFGLDKYDEEMQGE